MKHFKKSEYTLGSDGFYRRLVCFGTKREIIVRDERGDIVRIEKVTADARGNTQCTTITQP